MKSQDETNGPLVPATLEEITAIDSVLYAYLSFLRGGVEPSKQRDEQIELTQKVRRRIRPMRTFQAGKVVQLTPQEAGTMRAAMVAFVELLRVMIPQSQDRDATMAFVESLLRRLSAETVPRND
jgi:hypothetical protein